MKPAGGCSPLFDGNGYLERLALKLGGANDRDKPDSFGCACPPGEGGHTPWRNNEWGWTFPFSRQLGHPNLAVGSSAGPHGEGDVGTSGYRGRLIYRQGNRQ